jgi:hypothetical protein
MSRLHEPAATQLGVAVLPQLGRLGLAIKVQVVGHKYEESMIPQANQYYTATFFFEIKYTTTTRGLFSSLRVNAKKLFAKESYQFKVLNEVYL